MDIGFILGLLPRVTAGAIALRSKWIQINSDGKITAEEIYAFALAVFLVIGDIWGQTVPVPDVIPSSVTMPAMQTKVQINDVIENDPSVRKYAGK